LCGEDRQHQRGDHKNRCRRRRQLAEEIPWPTRPEDGLAGPTKRRTDPRSLACLQEHNQNQGNGHDHMHDN
jgi:hypothetical protein